MISPTSSLFQVPPNINAKSVANLLVLLSSTTLCLDDFTLEDRVLFKQGYNSHGKSFHRIKQMVEFLHMRNKLNSSSFYSDA